MKNWLKLKRGKIGAVEILLFTALILVDLYKLYYTWIAILTIFSFIIYNCLRLYLWGSEYTSKNKTVLYLVVLGYFIVLVYAVLHLEPI